MGAFNDHEFFRSWSLKSVTKLWLENNLRNNYLVWRSFGWRIISEIIVECQLGGRKDVFKDNISVSLNSFKTVVAVKLPTIGSLYTHEIGSPI